MGDHPYRHVSNTAPYPTQDIGPSESSSSNPPSMTEVTSGLEDLHLPPNQNKITVVGILSIKVSICRHNNHRDQYATTIYITA